MLCSSCSRSDLQPDWSARLIVGIPLALLAILIVSYPVLVFYGLRYLDVKIVGLVACAIFVARFLLMGRRNTVTTLLVTAVGVVACLLALLSNQVLFMRFVPALINAALAGVFLHSLYRPPSMIERFARLIDPELPAEAIGYTTTVTKVWIGFFVFNGSIAAYTSMFSTLEIWALYNGLIAYMLIAALFSAEYLARTIVRRRQRNQESR